MGQMYIYKKLYACCNQKVKATCMQLVDANLWVNTYCNNMSDHFDTIAFAECAVYFGQFPCVYTGCCVIAIIASVHVTETLNELQSCLSNNNVSDLKVIHGGLGSLAVSIYSVFSGCE